MRKVLVLLAALVVCYAPPSFASSADMKIFRKNMKMYVPISIKEKDKTVFVVMDEPRVTDAIYSSVVNEICTPLYLKQKKDFFKNVEDVRVFNKTQTQGFILKKPYQLCKDMGSTKGEETKKVLAKSTESFDVSGFSSSPNTTTGTRAEKIKAQFSAWDGSHRLLVKMVEKGMHDPDSFEHVDTFYNDMGDKIRVTMKFRGKNKLGAKVLNTVKAEFDIDGNFLREVK